MENTEATTLIVVNGAGRRTAKVHTVTCKRANMSLGGHSYGAQTGDADLPSATCCKPSDAKRAAALEATTPEPEQDAPAAVEVTDAATMAERRKLAKAEHSVVKAWKDGGEQGPRPATPNMDAVEADAGKPAQARVQRTSSGTSSRTYVNDRHRELCAARQALKGASTKGKRRKITEEELTAYVREVRAAHPDSPEKVEREYAYWVELIALSEAKFSRAWEAAAPSNAQAA